MGFEPVALAWVSKYIRRNINMVLFTTRKFNIYKKTTNLILIVSQFILQRIHKNCSLKHGLLIEQLVT